MIFNSVVMASDNRELLAKNLTLMGVPASASESLDELAAKVLQIFVGDTTREAFRASLTEEEYPTGEIGFIPAGRRAGIAEVVNITVFCCIAEMTVRLSPYGDIAGFENLTITAPGWTVTEEPGESGEAAAIVLTRTMADTDTRFTAMNALADISVSCSNSADISVRLQATGSVEGETFTAAGACRYLFKLNSFDLIEAAYPTWADAEGRTWTEVEHFMTD